MRTEEAVLRCTASFRIEGAKYLKFVKFSY